MAVVVRLLRVGLGRQIVLVVLVVGKGRRPAAAAAAVLTVVVGLVVVGEGEEGRVGADDLVSRRQLALAVWCWGKRCAAAAASRQLL